MIKHDDVLNGLADMDGLAVLAETYLTKINEVLRLRFRSNCKHLKFNRNQKYCLWFCCSFLVCGILCECLRLYLEYEIKQLHILSFFFIVNGVRADRPV